jgi:LuxR family maltose regulon positive regulatory protein
MARAQEWVKGRELSVDDDLSYLREFEHLTLARVLLAEYASNPEEAMIQDALRLLNRLSTPAEEQNRMGSILEILLVTALAYHALGSNTQAFASLAHALRLARPEGYARIFVGEGQPMQTLLSDFRASEEKKPHGKDHELTLYTDRLLSAFTSDHKEMRGSKLIEPLSKRELEILHLIAQGLSNQEIGERLFLALNTVKGHNQVIFDKLQVQRRTEAVARARELDLLQP